MRTKIKISKFVSLFVLNIIVQTTAIQAQSFRFFINEFMASNNQILADEAGDYDDWIEIYNDEEDTVKLKGFFLTDNYSDLTQWAFPDTFIAPKGFLIIWADADSGQGRLHCNFKLSAPGEQIAILYDNQFIDSLSFGQQQADISYGRYPDGSPNWYFFLEPTPATSNGPATTQFVENPVFSPPGGFFDDSVTIAIRLTSSIATICYSLDCSDPTENSPIYTSPVKLNGSTVIRARAYQPGYLPSDIITHSYFTNEDFTFATLSLVTDPPNLWDEDSGIYVNPNKRGDAWERPVAIELFDPDAQLFFSANAGIRIGGEASRGYAKKAFRLYFRSEYELSWLEYPLFHAKCEIDRFKRLSVHAGSTDMPANPFGYGWTLLRDPLMYELGRRLGCIYPANQPVAVFLNGERWGIYNLMERIDKYFTDSNFGELDVDLIENNTGARDGDMTEWNKLIDFFESHDFSNETNYDIVKTMIDIQNFTNYHILEIFSGNGDWTHHNVFCYRPRQEGAIWRWILWDMDGCFGPYGMNHNMLEFATRNDPATIILRKILENQNYRHLFINRFADLLNSTFRYNQVNNLIDSLANVIRTDINFETDRWGSSPRSWEQNGVNGQLRDFAQQRPDIVRYHISQHFDLDGEVTLTIEPLLAGKGAIRVNSMITHSMPWCGIYFKNIPIELEAIPAPQYFFKKWSDSSLPHDSKITVVMTEDLTIAAEFELDTSQVDLVINEINYNSAPAFDPGDWIELFNPSPDTVDLRDWCFKDKDQTHQFLFPDSTRIMPDGYLVLCQNRAAFHNHFPELVHYIGDFNFGLNADGDEVRIYNACSRLIDSVKFDDAPPWQTEPDGNGPTLELIDPDLDNTRAENWRTSKGHGSPGKQNSISDLVIFSEKDITSIPEQLILFQNSPNPFNNGTQIKYVVSIPAHVQIIIYNFLGEEVKNLVNYYHSAGSYITYWEGKDNQGRLLPSGIYFCQLKAGRINKIKKMIITR